MTFGCKINFYDTQAIREAILDLGYREVPLRGEARDAHGLDLLVVNNCTVTARAGDRGAAAVRRLARQNPEAQIVVTGCLTEEDRRAVSVVPGVHFVVGNEEKDQIPALLQGAGLRPTRGRRSRDIFELSASRFSHRTRAFLKVHDGCDSFCSYCIIPFLRGKSKSRTRDDVVAEARRFAEAGHREIVLTGIHLSQYGRDLRGEDTRLVALLRELRTIDGIDRVRLSSIGEGAFSDEFVAAFQEDPGLCRFFHIPLQSGSDAVLGRMRRDYDVAVYLGTIDRIRELLPDAMIATDLMVGFPGETEEEFAESLATARRSEFAKMHIFPYSPRPRTKAAQLPDPVPADVVTARMREARRLDAELAAAHRQSRVGTEAQVLVERHRDGRARGSARAGFEVTFPAPGARESWWNREVAVRIIGERDGRLEGEPLVVRGAAVRNDAVRNDAIQNDAIRNDAIRNDAGRSAVTAATGGAEDE